MIPRITPVFLTLILTSVPSLLLVGQSPDSPNLVINGDFERPFATNGKVTWETSGSAGVSQAISRDVGREGGRSVKLHCDSIVGSEVDSYAVVYQRGQFSIKKGKWYRLSFWAKAQNIARPFFKVKVVNTNPWFPSGIDDTFVTSSEWRYVEIYCQATADVAPEFSRLQFGFPTAGTLWLDDVVLEETNIEGRQFHPEIPIENVNNFIPNSSFECGESGWGSFSPPLRTAAGNLYKFMGDVVDSDAFHGKRCLKIELNKNDPDEFHYDYVDARVEPIHVELVANKGWFPLEADQEYILSCYLRSDSPETPALLEIHQGSGSVRHREVKVNQEWKRYSMRFTPNSDFAWIGVGLDLRKSALKSASLWIDAVQLEQGPEFTDYEVRSPTESFIATRAAGNLFTHPENGMTVEVSMSNSAEAARTIQGDVVITDFENKERHRVHVKQQVDPQSSKMTKLDGLLAHQRGFFRVRWTPGEKDQAGGRQTSLEHSLRCALIDPCTIADTPFGVNHAYPWDFLLDHCKMAGLTWIRDWSAKWHSVEPDQDNWDFSAIDPQIDRVAKSQLNTLMLFPFSSTPWSGDGNPKALAEVSKGDYLKRRKAISLAPRDPALFQNYVARTVERYRDRVSHYQVLNEPLYTTYSLPSKFGYTMNDYVKIVKDTNRTIKSIQPDATIIGGMGHWVDSSWVKDFIEADGLAACDVMDLHLYPPTIQPTILGDELVECVKRMRERDQIKPIWLTEFGCYADDDLYRTPGPIENLAMTRSKWPSERDASEALVKTAATFLHGGITKIFYHLGAAASINGSDTRGVFFEYGGTPRKMYVAQNVLSNRLGAEPKPIAILNHLKDNRIEIFPFTTDHGQIAIVWANEGETIELSLNDEVEIIDIMGNRSEATSLVVDSTPVYLLATGSNSLLESVQFVP